VTLEEGPCVGTNVLGSATTLDAAGKATFNLSTLPVGSHNLSACYPGNASFKESSASLVQVVNKANTTTALTSSSNPAVFSELINLKITVTVDAPGTQTPDGVVALKEGDCATGTPIGSNATLDANGKATFNVSDFSVGTHNLSACYAGTGSFEKSTGTLAQVVNKASTQTALTSSSNPSVYSELVGLHVDVTVVTPATATPVGDVTLKEGSCVSGTALAGPSTLDALGKASFNLSTLSVGSHALTACYGGNGNFDASYGYLTQVVNKASTTTAITSSVNPSILAQNVTFSVTVAKVAPATATPQGDVTLREGSCAGGALGGPTALNASGQASFNVSSLSIGSHNIYACYAGNTNFLSSSKYMTQEVHYEFSGFFAPVDRPNTMNISKAGQAIPLKWRLTDAYGHGIAGVTGVTVQAYNMGCSAGQGTDLIEEYAAGASGLQDLGDGYYQFNWKTPTSYVGLCKSIALTFASGGLGYTETPSAYFTFKK
jgi:hypothetical protein